MNFNHLEYAIAVAKCGSISKASRSLFMSQPYLSGMIKGLEEELGYQIFERTPSGITLTEEGDVFIKSAQTILLELKKMRELNLDKEDRPLNISSYYATYIMDMFLRFRNISSRKYSDKIKEMGTHEVLESVLSGDSSLGIIFYAQEKAKKYEASAKEMGLCFHELFKPMTVYAIMSPTHPLASLSEIPIQKLEKYPYVSYDDESSKQYLLNALGIANHPQLLEVSDRGSFYDALSSGEYLSVMAFREKAAQNGYVLVPFKEKKLSLLSSYITANHYKLTKREKDFLRFLQKGYLPLEK